MLSKLLKPAWKSPSAEKRRKAIIEMHGDSAEHQQILLQLALEDEDDANRIAAIQRISSVTALHELSTKLTDDPVRLEAENRVNELLAASHAHDETQYQNLLTRYPDLQLRIATHASSPSLRTQAMQTLSSAQLLQTLSTTTYTDGRQWIAEKLTDIEDLESARRIMRGKDKNAERIVKSKIDAIRSEERQQAENRARVDKLIEEVEYLASHDWLPEFQARCRAHRQQWDSLEFDIDEDAGQRYRRSRVIVDANYQQQQNIEQALQSQHQLVSQLETLLQTTASMDFAGSIEAQSKTRSQLQQFESDWQVLSKVAAPDKLIFDRYDSTLGALHSAAGFVAKVAELIKPEDEDPGEGEGEDEDEDEDSSGLARNCQQLEAALKKLKWPDEFAELRVATELRQQLADWRHLQQAAKDTQEKKLAQAHKNISAIFRFSRAGNLARAQQLSEKVQKALAQFDGKDLSALQERFEDARKILGDMGDWKNYATEPKYLELCESMELLVTSKQHPDKRSSDMKALQQQWKALGHSEISDQYWPRFKLAADKVYEPCAEFFKQRRQSRKDNLEKRQQYVEQMRELLETTDWDNNPDYRAAQSNLQNIRENFTKIKDVERAPGQKQWKQLSSYMDAVSTKLEVAYAANIELKQQLIRQLEALAEAPAKVDNLATLKTLQTRWKQIGITKRNQDQKAWRVFKQQGDIVYNRVQALRQQQRNETDQQLSAYRDIIKDIQKLARTTDNLEDAGQRFSELQASYAALPELPQQLPEKLREGIQRDYRKACDQYDNAQAQIMKNRRGRQIDALRLKAELCAQQEALGASATAQQLEELSQQWDAIELPNAELSRRIEARRDAAQSTIDRTEIGAERRLLCIQLEIAMDVESPSADRALRMQYQLEQMNKSGLGQQAVNRKELLAKMQLDWLCMPGAETAQQKILDERFQRVLRG